MTMPGKEQKADEGTSTSKAWDRFARENYGVSGDELSASALIDHNDHFFEKLRRGESVNLPSGVSKNLCRDGIVSSGRGPYNKRMVDWEKYDKLHGLRNRIR